MAIALSTHIKRKRTSIIGSAQQSSEASETVDEPCQKKSRQEEPVEGSASIESACDSERIKHAPQEDFFQVDLGLDDFQDQQSSEASETMDEPCQKKSRQEEPAEGSASIESACDSERIKNAPQEDFFQVDLGLDDFQEVSHEEYQSHMLSKMETYIKDLKYLRSQRAEFQARIKARARQAIALKRMVNALQVERESLKEELLIKEEHIESISRKHERDLQNAQKTLLTHDASKNTLCKQKAKYQELLQFSKQQMDTLHQQIEELEKKNEGLELLIESKDQIDQLSQEDPPSNESDEDLKKELSRLQNENKMLKESKSQTRDEEIAKLLSEKRALESKIQMLQGADKTRPCMPDEVDVVSVSSSSTGQQSTVPIHDNASV